MTTKSFEGNVKGFRSGMHGRAPAPGGHTLAGRAMLTLPNEEISVVCLAGELWLTREGDIEDHILRPGQCFTVRRGERGAVQALKPSQLSVLSCLTSMPQSGAKTCNAAPSPKPQSILADIDIAAIEKRARRLRAEEILRIGRLIAARLRLYGGLLAASVLSAAATAWLSATAQRSGAADGGDPAGEWTAGNYINGR